MAPNVVMAADRKMAPMRASANENK